MKDVAGYWAILVPDKKSGTIGVVFPDHPNIITYGNDREQAIEMGAEALNATLEVEFDRHLPLPRPSGKPKTKTGREAVYISLDPEVRTAFLVRGWREQTGLSQAQIAKRMGISTQAYQRMERPGRSNLTVATLDRITQAMGKHLVLRTE
jgi:antitoxin HicB